MRSTRQGAFFSTYSVEGPTSAGRAAPIPPRMAPPRILLGGSPPITIASGADSRAACTIPAPISRARKVGAGIVEAARRHDSEAIVVGAEPPSRVRGGAKLGGIGAAKPEEIGAATEYVLMKAPCRVLLTAPPEAAVDPEPEPAAAD